MSLNKPLNQIVSILLVSLNLIVSCTFHKGGLSNPTIYPNPSVTFIIPTLGRPTLKRTIQSLQAQHNPNWEAIIIFDGLTPQPLTTDPRLRMIEIPKTGRYNHAGEVRNQGMKYVTTEWMAFVDDDDTLTPDYVDRLLEESQRKADLTTVIFRMYDPELQQIVPEPHQQGFSSGHVGISYSIKTSLYQDGFRFVPGPTEDFKLLEAIRQAGQKMVLSPYITYWVRSSQKQATLDYRPTYTRAYFN
jgi:glycosyltransferase involved in cell wall biosynthesis